MKQHTLQQLSWVMERSDDVGKLFERVAERRWIDREAWNYTVINEAMFLGCGKKGMWPRVD